MPDEAFKEKIDQLAAAPADNAAAVSSDQPKRGRPKGYSPKAAKLAEAAAAQAQVIPPVNEMEAALFAQILAGAGNAFVKKEFKDRLNFTPDEFLTITRPMVQLKAYYMPNMGGIYSIWLQFGLAAGALGLAKYKTIKEIMDESNGKQRKENNPDLGDQGNRKVNEGEGTLINAPARTDL